MFYLSSSNTKSHNIRNLLTVGFSGAIASIIINFGPTILNASLQEKAEKRQSSRQQEIEKIRLKEKFEEEEKARLKEEKLRKIKVFKEEIKDLKDIEREKDNKVKQLIRWIFGIPAFFSFIRLIFEYQIFNSDKYNHFIINNFFNLLNSTQALVVNVSHELAIKTLSNQYGYNVEEIKAYDLANITNILCFTSIILFVYINYNMERIVSTLRCKKRKTQEIEKLLNPKDYFSNLNKIAQNDEYLEKLSTKLKKADNLELSDDFDKLEKAIEKNRKERQEKQEEACNAF